MMIIPKAVHYNTQDDCKDYRHTAITLLKLVHGIGVARRIGENIDRSKARRKIEMTPRINTNKEDHQNGTQIRYPVKKMKKSGPRQQSVTCLLFLIKRVGNKMLPSLFPTTRRMMCTHRLHIHVL